MVASARRAWLGRRRGLLAALLLLSGWAWWGLPAAQAQVQAQNAEPVVVFAAASLKEALDEVAAQWTQQSAVKVVGTYAGSNTLARQIEQGAPADLFISASPEWMQYLSERGFTRKGTERDWLGNRLVLIAPSPSKLRLKIAPGFALAQALGDGRLALCNPAVPAGAYGQQALQALNVWPQLAARTAPAENVRAALLLVARGEAPLGVVYETDARAEPKVRVLDRFPEDTHEPIVYPAALIAASRHPQGQALLDYIASPAARAVFERRGFSVLPPARQGP